MMLCIDPTLTIVDITHAIAPQARAQAAETLHAAYRYFPSGTVHVVVVDPGVGSSRDILALSAGGFRFVVPNNGLVTPVLAGENPELAVRVENPAYQAAAVSQTFHGRDIFAPVAAHLAGGLPLAALGPAVAPGDIRRLHLPTPTLEDADTLVGQVVAVDRFGNLITNIEEADLQRFLDGCAQDTANVTIGRTRIQGLSRSYVSVPTGRLLAIIGSRATLEIAVNGGNARRILGNGPGCKVYVTPLTAEVHSG